MWDIALGLGISALPTRPSLAVFRTLGFTDLVNVSGASTANLYQAADLAQLSYSDYLFVDAFSGASDVAAIRDLLGPDGVHKLKQAVQQVAGCLQQGRPVMVFCHLGVGRSPTVATMALMLARNCTVEAAARIVARLRPRAALNPAICAFATQIVAELENPQ